MVDAPAPQFVGVSANELRARFESIHARAQRGELIVVVLDPADKPAPGNAGQMPGTLTQMISYRESECGNELARAHQYLKPDGTLGGSGKPDPKLVLEGGILYGQQRKRQPS